MRIILSAVMALFALSVTAKPLPVEYFSKDEDYFDVKLSPSGDYLSARFYNEGKTSLAILDLNDNFSVKYIVNFANNTQVGQYHWVNNERVVAQVEHLKGWFDHPIYQGELFAFNADGSQSKYLVGYRGDNSGGSRIKKATPLFGTSYVLDPLVDDEDKMLIVTYPWTSAEDPHPIVYEVHVTRGSRKMVTRSPSPSARFLTDESGHVRIAVSTIDYTTQELHIRDNNSDQWKRLNQDEFGLYNIGLWGFNQAGDKLIISATEDGGPEGVYLVDLASGAYQLVGQDEFVSPSNVWVDAVSKEIFAIEHEVDYPTYSFVDSSSPKSTRLRSLLHALEGFQVRIVSSTVDDKLNVIWAGSDKAPARYFIFDTEKNKLSFLFSSRQWVDPKLMAEVKPIKFQARDGLTVHGYLTVPQGKELKDLPLVVLPHGGPHGPRDWWGFNPETQLLANQGYAVLQVNFRGSGGFGANFEHKGHRRWGSDIQYDIIDGVNYTIEQGWVDKQRMCIMGASFGGYSALQSAILEPDMFKCAIGVVGVYDLPLMFKEGDIAARDSGQRYLKRVLGDDQAQLQQFSPTYNIDKLKANVLIVHGGEDERAPIEQANALIKALDADNHPYEYMLLNDEGHGFYKPVHRQAYYQRVVDFLAKHL